MPRKKKTAPTPEPQPEVKPPIDPFPGQTAARPRQGFIPGTEPESIPVLDEAAESYVQARDGRMAAGKTEIERHDKLLGLMHEHGLDAYEFDGYIVSLASKEKVKVKRSKDADPDEED